MVLSRTSPVVYQDTIILGTMGRNLGGWAWFLALKQVAPRCTAVLHSKIHRARLWLANGVYLLCISSAWSGHVPRPRLRSPRTHP